MDFIASYSPIIAVVVGMFISLTIVVAIIVVIKIRHLESKEQGDDIKIAIQAMHEDELLNLLNDSDTTSKDRELALKSLERLNYKLYKEFLAFNVDRGSSK